MEKMGIADILFKTKSLLVWIRLLLTLPLSFNSTRKHYTIEKPDSLIHELTNRSITNKVNDEE